MKTRSVVFTRRAIDQLSKLYAWIESESGVHRAEAFTNRIVAYCEGLNLFPERGSRREDLRPGLRIIGFRRLVTIAITVEPEAVVILGIYYGGRDYEIEFRRKDDRKRS